jgi:hypothetical protein
MISFSKLGHMGRLGNQLFQYAFLRTTAQRLGVKFYCPGWIGDEIFLLNDSEIRAETPNEIYKSYMEPASYKGLNREALEIADGTDIAGQFETDRYWNGELVKNWYSFREIKICRVREKYAGINFGESTGVHLRFGDKLSTFALRINYFIARPEYYVKALSCVRKSKNIIIFSDQIEIARRYLQALSGNFIFIDNNQPYEDLYLMTLCRDFIFSASTLGWWGGYLNRHSDSQIVAPYEGVFRPGSALKNNDYVCPNWIKIRALRPYLDSYIITALKEGLSHPREIPDIFLQIPNYFYKTIVLPLYGYIRKLVLLLPGIKLF